MQDAAQRVPFKALERIGMARRLLTGEADVRLSHRLVQLTDQEAEEALPTPRQAGHPWLSVGTSAVLLESAEDILTVQFLFESWDGDPPPLDELEWPRSEIVRLRFPSGILGVYEFTHGGQSDVFDVGAPGVYRVRVAWRTAGEVSLEHGVPQAFALFQFWKHSES